MGAGRVAGDGGGTAAVAQVVEKDLAAAFVLGHVRGQAFGFAGGEGLADGTGEGLGVVPIRAAFDGYDQMQALAAGGA